MTKQIQRLWSSQHHNHVIRWRFDYKVFKRTQAFHQNRSLTMLSEHPVRLSHYKWRKSKINSVLHLDISRVSRFRRSVKRRIILGQLQRRRIYCSRPYKDRLSVFLKGWSIVGIEEPSITLLLLQVCRESKSPSPTTTTSMCFCSNHPIRISEFVIDLLLAIAIFVMRFFFLFWYLKISESKLDLFCSFPLWIAQPVQ